jgi:hypothetical protein
MEFPPKHSHPPSTLVPESKCVMTLFSSDQDQENEKMALRSLIAALEFATEIFDSLPNTLLEIDETKNKLNEALLACCRLNLSNNIYLGNEPINDQRPNVMSA